jgi:hypothetical protein
MRKMNKKTIGKIQIIFGIIILIIGICGIIFSCYEYSKTKADVFDYNQFSQSQLNLIIPLTISSLQIIISLFLASTILVAVSLVLITEGIDKKI